MSEKQCIVLCFLSYLVRVLGVPRFVPLTRTYNLSFLYLLSHGSLLVYAHDDGA